MLHWRLRIVVGGTNETDRMERQKRPQPSLLFYWETRVNGCLLPAMRDCCLRMYKEEQLLNERLSHAQAVTWRSWTSRERQESSARFPPFIPTRSAKTKKKDNRCRRQHQAVRNYFSKLLFPSPSLSLVMSFMEWKWRRHPAHTHTRKHIETVFCFLFFFIVWGGKEK